MVVRSPYPDVDVPDVGLPEFLFGDLERADAARVRDHRRIVRCADDLR